MPSTASPVRLPPAIARRESVQQLVKRYRSAKTGASRARAELAELKAPATTAAQAATVIAGAGLAGQVDGRWQGEGVAGVPMSGVVGVLGIAGGAMMGQPWLAQLGAGMVAGPAYLMSFKYAHDAEMKKNAEEQNE